MPRSSRKDSSTSTNSPTGQQAQRTSKSKSAIKAQTTATPDQQWVYIANAEIFTDQESMADKDKMPALCKLRHPRMDKGVLFLISPGSNCKIYELNCFQEKYRSWFIGESVHKSGSFYVTTPVDPVFLILPYLINAGQGKQFMSIDQMVCDDEFPDCHRLLSCSGLSQLDQVTDSKDVCNDLTVHRFNKDKMLTWLKAKVEATAVVLEKKGISANSKGSSSAIFIRSKNNQVSRECLIRYAFGMVSDYLPTSVEKELEEYLGISDVKEGATTPEVSENAPPSKKTKLSSESEAPLEDYSQPGLLNLKKEKSKTSKPTAAQRKLSKVDCTGMKSISSFFSPKA